MRINNVTPAAEVEGLEVSRSLIEAAFDVILECYLRMTQQSGAPSAISRSRIEQLRLEKPRMLQDYEEAAQRLRLNRLALLRHMRYDLRSRLDGLNL
jgi:hypothetical protein